MRFPRVIFAGGLLALVAGCGRAKVETAEGTPQFSGKHETRSDATPMVASERDFMKEPYAPQEPPQVRIDPATFDWEQRIPPKSDQMSSAERAKAIFALLPSLPREALMPATQEAIQDLKDADYSAVAFPIVTNPATHGQVESVLFADLLKRPATVTLPALASIAANPAHPWAPSALDDLKYLLRVDYGKDWAQWNEAIRQKLSAPAAQ